MIYIFILTVWGAGGAKMSCSKKISLLAHFPANQSKDCYSDMVYIDYCTLMKDKQVGELRDSAGPASSKIICDSKQGA